MIKNVIYIISSFFGSIRFDFDYVEVADQETELLLSRKRRLGQSTATSRYVSDHFGRNSFSASKYFSRIEFNVLGKNSTNLNSMKVHHSPKTFERFK